MKYPCPVCGAEIEMTYDDIVKHAEKEHGIYELMYELTALNNRIKEYDETGIPFS